MDSKIQKIYPKTTPEVAQMLGMSQAEATSSVLPETAAAEAPGNLPVVDAEVINPALVTDAVASTETVVTPTQDTHAFDASAPVASASIPTPGRDVGAPISATPSVGVEEIWDESKNKSLVKTILPYVAIFVVGIFLYYFYFSTFSFVSITNLFNKAKVGTTVTTQVTDKTNALDQLKQNQLAAYQAYMKQFYFDVSDSSILDPDGDNSHNGLTNFQEYLLNLNPKIYSSLGNGQADSQTLAAGIDPGTGETLNGAHQKIVADYFDMEVASNMLALGSLQNPNAASQSQTQSPTSNLGMVAGASVGARNAGASAAGSAVLGAETTAPSSSAPTTTNPAPNVNVQAPKTAPVTGSGYSQPAGLPGESQALINDNVNASLYIPSLSITVPIIWTKDTKNFDKDLENGVVHYPGTAMPGEFGTSYISGHSSNYIWKKGSYKKVFATLDKLKPGDSFVITVTLKNGQTSKLHYVVTKQQQFKADDPAQFADTGKSVVVLSTCWPVGTTARRLGVFAELTQVEK